MVHQSKTTLKIWDIIFDIKSSDHLLRQDFSLFSTNPPRISTIDGGPIGKGASITARHQSCYVQAVCIMKGFDF